MYISLDRITVGHGIPGSAGHGETLYVWDSPEAAEQMVDNSPISDEQMMSTTTYHRAATMADVARLQYDCEGRELAAIKIEKYDGNNALGRDKDGKPYISTRNEDTDQFDQWEPAQITAL